MGKLKDRLLNGLLALMVIISVALSAQVWFPSEAYWELPTSGEAQVQPAPPVVARNNPEIFKPERILVRRQDGQAAILQSGSVAHTKAWEVAQSTLTRIRPTLVSVASVTPEHGTAVEGEWVVVYLPIALRLGEWAERWTWNTLGPANQSVLIDRVTFHVGKEPGILLTGPTGGTYRLASFPQIDQERFRDFISQQIDPWEFFKPKQLAVQDLPARVTPDLLVPDVKSMPDARVRAHKPWVDAEKARFFPDLSVVRVIDEKDAKSFTDGQRLLRLAASGLLEFRTVGTQGQPLTLGRAMTVAQDWVGTHGGWSQDLVMSKHVQEPGNTSLLFDMRALGPYPIESDSGAMQVDFSGERVIYLKRFPDFTEIVFGRLQVPIISPEEALKVAIEDDPLPFFKAVRDIHPAYRIRPGQGSGESEWLLEPVWVIQTTTSRIYVPAVRGLNQKPAIQIL